MFKKTFDYLEQPVSSASLVVFRICFAIVAIALVIEYYHGHWIDTLQSTVHFPLLDGCVPESGIGLHIHLVAVAVFAALIGFGLRYRIACPLFFLSYSYIFLSEKSLYQNHLYLICLLGFLFCFVGANRSLSVDSRSRTLGGTVPRWNVLLLRFQFVIVYLFSGLAKLNMDWLHGNPQTKWLLDRSTDLTWGPIFGSIFREHWFVLLITYGGIAVDLVLPLLLCSKRTFKLGAVLAVVFNLMNLTMFPIDIFPILMIASIGLFAPEDWPERLASMRKTPASAPQFQTEAQSARMVYAVLIPYLAFQLLFPLRHFLYPGDPSWTEEGQRFAWRMMLRDKQCAGFKMIFVDQFRNITGEVHPETDVTQRQLDDLRVIPDMILQYSHYVASDIQSQAGSRPAIRVQSRVSLNGHPVQNLINRHVDLGTTSESLYPASWIIPLGADKDSK